MLLPDQLRALGPDDEASLTYANVRRRLDLARARLGVRRALAVTPDLAARGDTSNALPFGARAYEIGADRAELARAASGTPAASPLFVGHDGVPYKRAYAAVGEPGAVAGFVGGSRAPSSGSPKRRRGSGAAISRPGSPSRRATRSACSPGRSKRAAPRCGPATSGCR